MKPHKMQHGRTRVMPQRVRVSGIKDAKQHAQAAKAVHAFKWEGMKITIKGEIPDVDGVLGALDENEPQAKVYSQGLYTFIYYPAKGKLAVSKEGKFEGYATKIK